MESISCLAVSTYHILLSIRNRSLFRVPKHQLIVGLIGHIYETLQTTWSRLTSCKLRRLELSLRLLSQLAETEQMAEIIGLDVLSKTGELRTSDLHELGCQDRAVLFWEATSPIHTSQHKSWNICWWRICICSIKTICFQQIFSNAPLRDVGSKRITAMFKKKIKSTPRICSRGQS